MEHEKTRIWPKTGAERHALLGNTGDRPLCAHRSGPGRPQRQRRRERSAEVGMSIQSHDASQRTQGFLCLFGGLMIAFAKEILTAIGVV